VGCDPTITPHSTILRECIAKTRANAIALVVEDYHIWIGIHHDVVVSERVDLSWVDFHTINDHEV
jgi:hypothetical protein